MILGRERRPRDWCSSIASLLRIRQFERKTKNRRTIPIQMMTRTRTWARPGTRRPSSCWRRCPIVWSLLVTRVR